MSDDRRPNDGPFVEFHPYTGIAVRFKPRIMHYPCGACKHGEHEGDEGGLRPHNVFPENKPGQRIVNRRNKIEIVLQTLGI